MKDRKYSPIYNKNKEKLEEIKRDIRIKKNKMNINNDNQNTKYQEKIKTQKNTTKTINKRLINPNISERKVNYSNSNRVEESPYYITYSKEERNIPINENEINNHQFYSSYFSNRNINKKPKNSNSYSKYSNRLSQQVLNDSSINTSRNTNTKILNLNSSFTPSRRYFPSSQTTNLRRRKLPNGCYECPNCRFVFNPNEEYIQHYPKYTLENQEDKYLNYKSEANVIPFDIYGDRKTVSTTIETKTNFNPPNIYTNERGTTIFTQPKRHVQVIRKSLGANGEVLESEIKRDDDDYYMDSGNRYSYDRNVVNNNSGYFDSYGTRIVRNNQGYPYSEYY